MFGTLRRENSPSQPFKELPAFSKYNAAKESLVQVFLRTIEEGKTEEAKDLVIKRQLSVGKLLEAVGDDVEVKLIPILETLFAAFDVHEKTDANKFFQSIVETLEQKKLFDRVLRVLIKKEIDSNGIQFKTTLFRTDTLATRLSVIQIQRSPVLSEEVKAKCIQIKPKKRNIKGKDNTPLADSCEAIKAVFEKEIVLHERCKAVLATFLQEVSAAFDIQKGILIADSFLLLRVICPDFANYITQKKKGSLIRKASMPFIKCLNGLATEKSSDSIIPDEVRTAFCRVRNQYVGSHLIEHLKKRWRDLPETDEERAFVFRLLDMGYLDLRSFFETAVAFKLFSLITAVYSDCTGFFQNTYVDEFVLMLKQSGVFNSVFEKIAQCEVLKVKPSQELIREIPFSTKLLRRFILQRKNGDANFAETVEQALGSLYSCVDKQAKNSGEAVIAELWKDIFGNPPDKNRMARIREMNLSK